ncbi:MAG: excisionase family DNA-binding protein [Vicinamibacterales bacterium]
MLTKVAPSPWLRIDEAAAYARCGVKLLYREITASRLRACRVGGRRQLLTKAEWVDAWLEASATPIEERRSA